MIKKALVVDDSRVVRKTIIKMLAELNITAREAENGQVALDLCQIEKPDFVILDWNMPVMDGLSFIQEFRKDPENQKIIVIFCTSENEIAKIKQAIAAGSNEYIMKPFDLEIIKNKLIQAGVIEQ